MPEPRVPGGDMPDTEQLLGLANDVRMVCQQVSRRVRFEGDPEVAPHRFSVLVKLRHRAWTPGELAEAERISPPSMTRTVNCLVNEGLVEKYGNPADGRQKMLRLTTSGVDLVERTIAARDTWMVRRITELSLEDRRTLQQAVVVLQQVLAR